MKLLPIALVVLLLASTTPLHGGEEGEIDYLLSFIGGSGCTFIRNGNAYSGEKAREHLAYKYGRVKSKIKGAEEFIDHIASASSISGRPYLVECGKRRMTARDWLTEALASHRAAAKKEP